MDKTIAVTGAGGQLGKCLQDMARLYPHLQFHFFNREELPLNDFERIRQQLEAIKPDVVINAAAYTAVDKAETESDLAFLVNGLAVGELAEICKSIGARLLHVSTDYVFDGNAETPYTEDAAVAPINVYGASKQEGEKLLLASDGEAAVIRTSWVYSRHGNNFVKTMLRLMKERESIGVVSDQVGCPTYAIDLAEALITLAMAANEVKGIYHFSNSGPITWYEFANTIKESIGSACHVHPILTVDFPTPAKRPHYSVMSNEKIQAVFGIKQKQWKDSLQQCLAALAGN